MLEWNTRHKKYIFLMTLVQTKTGSKEGYRGKVPLIHFLRQSGNQHTKLKLDLQNKFTTDNNRYLKNRQVTLTLLEKYTKSSVI